MYHGADDMVVHIADQSCHDATQEPLLGLSRLQAFSSDTWQQARGTCYVCLHEVK